MGEKVIDVCARGRCLHVLQGQLAHRLCILVCLQAHTHTHTQTARHICAKDIYAGQLLARALQAEACSPNLPCVLCE